MSNSKANYKTFWFPTGDREKVEMLIKHGLYMNFADFIRTALKNQINRDLENEAYFEHFANQLKKPKVKKMGEREL